MIDYIVMLASQRKSCTDVQVMRGANCWTDHQMVRAKVYVYFVHSGRNKKKKQVPFVVQTLCNEDKADTYHECLSKRLKETPHNPGMPAEWNWKELKSCIVQTAGSKVGRVRQKQPDWFIESSDTLLPLIEMKNAAQKRML